MLNIICCFVCDWFDNG